MHKRHWLIRSRDAFDDFDRVATAAGWIKWLLGTWLGNAGLAFILSTGTALWAWATNAKGWQIGLAALAALALALVSVTFAVRLFDRIASSISPKKNAGLRILQLVLTTSQTSGGAASACYVPVKNATDDTMLTGVRAQITECSNETLLLPLNLRAHDNKERIVNLAPGQTELFEVFRCRITPDSRAELSFCGREVTVDVTPDHPVSIAVSAFGKRAPATARFVIFTKQGQLQVEFQLTTPSSSTQYSEITHSNSMKLLSAATRKNVHTLVNQKSFLPPAFRVVALFGRTVTVCATDAVLRTITGPMNTVEKQPIASLWPLRRRVPVTYIGLWFERDDGTEFDILLKNMVPPGQIGKRFTLLETYDEYGNGFMYSIYNHASARWIKLNSFQNLRNAEIGRYVVRWEKYVAVVSGMAISVAVWMSLFDIEWGWTYVFLPGFVLGVMWMATKAAECARLWRSLGRAQAATELSSVDHPNTITPHRAKALHEEGHASPGPSPPAGCP
jgi:hypothetical protein